MDTAKPTAAGLAKRRTGGPQGSGAGTVAQQQQGAKKMTFYTDSSEGLKVSPTTVLVLALSFMASVVAMHILGKLRGA